jgi:transcriptional regulator with XRE-family HTH domain
MLGPDEWARAIGLAIRVVRAGRGISQEQLARRAGIGKNYVGHLERAQVNPTMMRLVQITNALGITPEQLFERAERYALEEREAASRRR